jgi:hypothetical protein
MRRKGRGERAIVFALICALLSATVTPASARAGVTVALKD